MNGSGQTLVGEVAERARSALSWRTASVVTGAPPDRLRTSRRARTHTTRVRAHAADSTKRGARRAVLSKTSSRALKCRSSRIMRLPRGRCAVGDRIDASALVVGQADEVRRRLERCVAAMQRMVDGGWFDGHVDTIGMEVELDLVDPLGRPRLINDAVLARLGRADMQHELGQFNVELNLAPRRLQGRVLHDSERDLANVLEACRARIERLGVRLVAVGMLPTLSADELTVDRISHNPRYALLSSRMSAARQRPFRCASSTGASRWSSKPTRSPPTRPRQACSCTCGCHRTGLPRTTTPPK